MPPLLISRKDLVNEPHDLPSLTLWPTIAQAAIDAIRTVDKNTPIHLEGNSWSAASSWQAQNPGFPLTDPSNRIVYSPPHTPPPPILPLPSSSAPAH